MFWCDALSAPAGAARRGPPRGHLPPASHGCGARAPPSRPPVRRRLPKLKSPPAALATGRRAAPAYLLTAAAARPCTQACPRGACAHVLLALPLAALLVGPTISKVGASGMSWPSLASQSPTTAPASPRGASDLLAAGVGASTEVEDSPAEPHQDMPLAPTFEVADLVSSATGATASSACAPAQGSGMGMAPACTGRCGCVGGRSAAHGLQSRRALQLRQAPRRRRRSTGRRPSAAQSRQRRTTPARACAAAAHGAYMHAWARTRGCRQLSRSMARGQKHLAQQSTLMAAQCAGCSTRV